MQRPWFRAALLTSLGFLLLFLLIRIVLGPPASGAAEAMGRLAAACVCAGLISGWRGARALPAWSGWGWIGRWTLTLVVVWLLAARGHGH